MSVTCDGCGALVDEVTAVRVGRTSPCLYCPECNGRWQQFVREEQARRAQLIEEFEAWRDAELQILGAHWLKRLPDRTDDSRSHEARGADRGSL